MGSCAAPSAKGDDKFITTDYLQQCPPSDALAYGEAVKAIRGRGFGSIIACAVGPKAGHEHLKQLTDKVVSLETLDSTAFAGFFKWVSASVSSGSTSAGINNGTDTLPPPPPEIQLVL